MRFGGLDGCMALQASPTDASYSLCCCRPATSERSAFVLVLEDRGKGPGWRVGSRRMARWALAALKVAGL